MALWKLSSLRCGTANFNILGGSGGALRPLLLEKQASASNDHELFQFENEMEENVFPRHLLYWKDRVACQCDDDRDHGSTNDHEVFVELSRSNSN